MFGNGKDLSSTAYIKKRAYELLKDLKNESVPLSYIRKIIAKESGENYSHGMFSAAMRDLLEEEGKHIVNVDRGMYMYVSTTKKMEINEVLDNCKEELRKLAIIDYLEASDEELEYVKQIPILIKKIESMKIR